MSRSSRSGRPHEGLDNAAPPSSVSLSVPSGIIGNMVSIPALVDVSVLRWARESAGLSEIAASRKMKLPEDRVTAWESGDATPTIAQLRKAAGVYKRSFAVFFLAEPPSGFDTLRDFRRLAETANGTWSPALHEEYRRAHTQREYMLELADLEEIELPSTWRLAAIPNDTEKLATAARATLLEIAPLARPQGAGTVYDHLNVWVAALEAAGVQILATAGGKVEISEMRAFSLYFDKLPTIVVNGADGPRGRLFSLLHEYAHLMLHTSGLCDAITDTTTTSPDRQLEARCNAIAAAILMPAESVLARPEVIARDNSPDSWDYPSLRSSASLFGVSAEAFLRRLVTLGQVSSSFYERQREEFIAAYERSEATSTSGGGDWYRNTVRDRGKGYVRFVADAHRRRVIDSNTAAVYLNVKVDQIARLADTASLHAAV